MTDALNILANRPNMPMDGLSAILAKLGVTAEIFMQADLCGLWAMDTSGQRKMPFHLIEQGTGWLHTSGPEPPQMLGSGDFAIFPHDTPHCISSTPDRPPQEILNRLPNDTKGKVTSLLCGYFEFSNRNAWPLLDSLPDVIVLDLKEGGRQHSAYPLVQLMISELELDQPGKTTALNQLAYLMFIQVLRMQFGSPGSTGLIPALADRHIGRALNLLHTEFQRDWTVADLAKEIGVSRSVLSERFVDMVGKTPMRYLAEWRMQEAIDSLRRTDAAVATIAEDVGYRSEIAFRKAFRRITGNTPGAVRRERSQAGPVVTRSRSNPGN